MQPLCSRLDLKDMGREGGNPKECVMNVESSWWWLTYNWLLCMGIMCPHVTSLPIIEGATLYKSHEDKGHLKLLGELSSANGNQTSSASPSTKQTSNNKNPTTELPGPSLLLFNWDSPDISRNQHHFQIRKGIFRGTIIYQPACILAVELTWSESKLNVFKLTSQKLWVMKCSSFHTTGADWLTGSLQTILDPSHLAWMTESQA